MTRRMAIGANWTVLNLGIRFRQKRDGRWNGPDSLSGFRAGFGLVDSDGNTLGVRTSESWHRHSGNWWSTGWELFSGSGTHAAGVGLMRVSDTDANASAWYCRFTRGSGVIDVELFIPSGASSQGEFDFLMQLDREEWSNSVNNHQTYQQFAATVPIIEAFDTVNIFSTLDHFVTESLRGIEWVSVRAVRIE